MRSLIVPAFVIAALLVGASAPASTDGGLVSKRSTHTVDQTLDRLEAALKDAGAKIVARLDHTAEAKALGRSMQLARAIGTAAMQISNWERDVHDPELLFLVRIARVLEQALEYFIKENA